MFSCARASHSRQALSQSLVTSSDSGCWCCLAPGLSVRLGPLNVGVDYACWGLARSGLIASNSPSRKHLHSKVLRVGTYTVRWYSVIRWCV